MRAPPPAIRKHQTRLRRFGMAAERVQVGDEHEDVAVFAGGKTREGPDRAGVVAEVPRSGLRVALGPDRALDLLVARAPLAVPDLTPGLVAADCSEPVPRGRRADLETPKSLVPRVRNSTKPA
jgi:hypothetical protein